MTSSNTPDNELMNYMRGIFPRNGHVQFDFQDDRQYEYATMMTKKFAAKEKQTGLLRLLEMKKTQDKQKMQGANPSAGQTDNASEMFQDYFGVVSFGPEPDGTLSSTGIGTVFQGYQRLYLTVVAVDKTTGMVSYGNADGLVGTMLFVQTNQSNNDRETSDLFRTGDEEESKFASCVLYTAMDSDGNVISGQSSTLECVGTSRPVVTAPVGGCSNPYVAGAVNIGLGRPWNDSSLGKNLDYVWNESTTSKPVGKIPFVGSVVFANKIPHPLKLNQNLLLTISVTNEDLGGASKLVPEDMTKVFGGFSIDPNNPRKLNWSLPGGTSASKPGNPIVFSEIEWPTDMKAFFFCRITIISTTFPDFFVESADVMSVDNTVKDLSSNTAKIPPIAFVWHCLGQDTKVTMGDGSQKMIRDIVTGDVVAIDAKGATASVNYTLRGAWYGKVLGITAGNQPEIITSSDHVFLRGGVAVAASELKVGDAVLTVKGAAKITAIRSVKDYTGTFWNLALLENSCPYGVNTFVANGFVVGDDMAQRTYKETLKDDIDWVKKQVPEFMHADVDAIFKEKGTARRM